MAYTAYQARQDGERAGMQAALRGAAGEYGLSLIEQGYTVYRRGGTVALRDWLLAFRLAADVKKRGLTEEHRYAAD